MKKKFENKKYFFITLIIAIIVGAGIAGGSFLLKTAREPDIATVSIDDKEVQKDVKGANTIRFPIFIDTKEDTINAAEAYITFDKNIVQVEEVGKEGSFFKIWIDNQPKFDNDKGEISFAGGLPKPGFQGRGQIGTVTLKFLKNEEAVLTFTEKTRILKNDGLGTFVPLRLEPVTVKPG